MTNQRYQNLNPGKIGVRPLVNRSELDNEYREMAADKNREAEAREWCDALIGDVAMALDSRRSVADLPTND